MTDPDEAEQTFPASDPIGRWAGESPADVRATNPSMTTEEPRIDSQDQQVGSTGIRDH